MITFTIYSSEYPKGKVLAKVADQSQAHILGSYFQNTYKDERFKVTRRFPRKKEERIV